MTAVKKKISVSLDAELVRELEQGDEALSKQVNDAVRAALTARRRTRLLHDLLADMDACDGPLPPKLLDKYEALLS